MPIDISSANTLVTFSGLGMISFDSKSNQGEIAAIREREHGLKIKISQLKLTESAIQADRFQWIPSVKSGNIVG